MDEFVGENMANRKYHEMRWLVYDDPDKPPIIRMNPLKEHLNISLSNKLDQYRHENGWTMKEFSLRSGIPIATLRDLIHGREFPKYVHLLNLSAITGKTINYWKGLCIDGYWTAARGMIVSSEWFITVKGHTLECVPRHGGIANSDRIK